MSTNLEPIFCMLDFHFQIAQVKYRGQTGYTIILDSKPLTNAYDCIQNIKLKYLLFNVCTTFAQCLLDRSSISEK